MSRFDFYIRTQQDLIDAVEEFGFLPLFGNSIPGFSVEEHASPDAWYHADGSWPIWDWKGPVIQSTGCAYGKFFEKKAAFISRKWFPDFANLRRDGYDFDARCDEGLAPYKDRELYELIAAEAPVRTRTLKAIGGYGKDGKKGFETSMTRLQAQCYVVVQNFVYETNRHGVPYGWGVGEYTTPELMMGQSFTDCVYRNEPKASLEILLEYFRGLFPEQEEKKLIRLLTKQ